MARVREDTKTGYPFKVKADEALDDCPEITESQVVAAYNPDDEVAADPLIGTIVANRFRIARLLGEGNMARVYVAEQLSMDRNVAVKFLQSELLVDETAAGRFRKEVDAVSRLHSPHTISFLDAGQTPDKVPYIVMELLAGETLRERLETERVLAPQEVITITNQLACSLQEAHDADVLHRDLKPENVHFCRQATPLQPFVKLLDFGLAKLLDSTGPDNPTLTGKRQTVGTPAYIAPEMIVEERPVDHRGDIYSLAVMCFEMLTGTRPYNGKSAMAMALAHVREPIPSAFERNGRLPPRIDDFFVAAMAKNQDERPQQVQALAQMLVQCLS